MRASEQSWERRERTAFFHTFSDLPTIRAEGATVIERGEGVYIFDTAGRRYLEGNAGLWNMTLGFSEKRLVDVARRQYETLPGYHTFFARSSKPAVELAERLRALSPMPMGRVFFTNSGSEANEAVVKLLWMIWAAEGQPRRRKLITRKNAYHGAAVMTTSLTGREYVKAFGLPSSEVIVADCPHAWRHALPGEDDDAFSRRLAAALERTILEEGPDTIAGFFAEPIMGAGGVLIPPVGYFAHLQPVLKKYGIPLVGDEVICGFGRSGNLWGAQTVGMAPDIMVTSKSLSAGYFPIGAVLLSKEIDERLSAACEAWAEFPLGFTTGGHPVGCAVSLEAVRIIVEDGVLDHLRAVAPRFLSRLKALETHPLVGEARGVGLMGGLELVADKESKAAFPGAVRIGERIARAALERGLIVRPLGAALVVAPPFIITDEEIDALFSILKGVLDAVHEEVGRLAA